MAIRIFKSLFKRKKPKVDPLVIPRESHTLSRKHINPAAQKVLYGLHKAGCGSYLVGGCVRDLLLGATPKDFDVATDAHPEKIRSIFRSCHLIGRRFRLAHVRFGRDIIEVATFRAAEEVGGDRKSSEHGMIVRDNVYGTLEDDVWRRDFTVNALYYNIADFSVVDFTTGMQDLTAKIIRLIGDPNKRYQEDPVRILRAIRFAAKLGFTLHPETEKPIAPSKHLLQHVAPMRLFEELVKLLTCGNARQAIFLLRKYGLMELLFLETHQACEAHADAEKFTQLAITNTDKRLASGKTVNPAFLFSALFWHAFCARRIQHLANKKSPGLALTQAASEILRTAHKRIAIPKRFTEVIQELWRMQRGLERPRPRIAMALIQHKRFRAAYDFLLLRAEVEPTLKSVAQWWTAFEAASEDERQVLIAQL